jgi:putative nucleotidyltransferase with HDIG domain
LLLAGRGSDFCDELIVKCTHLYLNSAAMPFSPTHVSRLSLRIEQARCEFQLPEGAKRLIAADDLNRPNSPLLVRWLADDSQLCQRLLRWCNSPLYNLARPFKSLEEACNVMDGGELARLALLASIRGKFLPNVQIDQYCRDALWSHSIAVGAVASLVSRTCGCGDPSMIFLAGALHDIGLRASEQLDPDGFSEVVALVDEFSPINEVEQELQGWDHAELGEAILNQWAMPDAVTMAARYHHEPEHVLGGPEGAAIGCVTIANFLCSRAGWHSTGRHYLATPSNRVFSQLGIDANVLTLLWRQLSPALESVADLR